jgi:hypothetical protein
LHSRRQLAFGTLIAVHLFKPSGRTDGDLRHIRVGSLRQQPDTRPNPEDGCGYPGAVYRNVLFVFDHQLLVMDLTVFRV